MAHIQREELRRLARASRLAIAPKNEDRVINEISEILTYTQLLQRAIETQVTSKQITQEAPLLMVRPDTVMPSIGDQLLAIAPAQEAGYFVVPAIITQEK